MGLRQGYVHMDKTKHLKILAACGNARVCPSFPEIGELGQSSMLRRPVRRMVEKFFDFSKRSSVEVTARLGHDEHITPGGERLHRYSQFRDDLPTLLEDVVVEDDEDMVDLGAGAS